MAFLPIDETVPAQNSADNTTFRDVLGNKTDTVDGTSLVSLSKINKAAIDTIDGLHDVPSANSTDNVNVRDVLGNKTDTHLAGSLYGKLKRVDNHIYNKAMVYPDSCTPVTLEASATPNTYGTKVEIVGATGINNYFYIFSVNISDISAAGYFQIQLYKGAEGIEEFLTEKAFFKTASISQEGDLLITCPLIPDNVRISAAIKGSNSVADTCKVRIEYYEL